MKKMLHFLFVLMCMLNRQDVISQTQQTSTSPVIITELQLLDSNRNREIPALIYSKADILYDTFLQPGSFQSRVGCWN